MILFQKKKAYQTFGFAPRVDQKPFLYFFGSVGFFLKTDPDSFDELNELLKKFLEEAGFEVLAFKGLRQRFNWDIHRLPPSAAYRLTQEVVRGDTGLFGEGS